MFLELFRLSRLRRRAASRLAPDGLQSGLDGVFEVTEALSSGDRWTFVTENRERADEICEIFRESSNQVILNDLTRFESPVAPATYRVSGIDDRGDLWIFGSEDYDRAKAAIAYLEGYRDIRFREAGK